MGARWELEELGPAAGEEGVATLAEGGLAGGMGGTAHGAISAAAVELAASSGGVWAGGAVEDCLGEEHAGEEVPEGAPAGTIGR